VITRQRHNSISLITALSSAAAAASLPPSFHTLPSRIHSPVSFLRLLPSHAARPGQRWRLRTILISVSTRSAQMTPPDRRQDRRRKMETKLKLRLESACVRRDREVTCHCHMGSHTIICHPTEVILTPYRMETFECITLH